MTRSERMAPIGPSRLRVAVLVAWVRLGSAADHVSRLTPPAAQPTSTSNPSILQSQPWIASRNEDGSNGAGSSLRYAIPRERLGRYFDDTLEGLPDRCRIVHQCDANEVAARIDAVPVLVCQVNAR